MSYRMWLDDVRNPTDDGWEIARSTAEAQEMVERLGPPGFIAFDHDLGTKPDGSIDEAHHFLRWLINNYPDAKVDYRIHSSNPCGQNEIRSLMESWKKSKTL